MAWVHWPLIQLEAQRGGLFHWVPVAMAIGIGAYFAAPVEPGWSVYAAAGGAIGAAIVLAWRLGPFYTPPLALVALVALGFVLAGARAHLVAGPVLGFRYYGPVEGRIVEIDRSASDKLRLTLDRVVLSRVDPDKVPLRVRISLHGEQGYFRPEPGLRVMATAHLSGPEGPVEPGGFDFRRQAWFQGLGAVGYTRAPVLVAAPADEGAAGLAVHRARGWISARITAALPGQTGAFAAAILTGDRSGLSRDTVEALRAANTAHLLAISGLHMGLLTGLVFGFVRLLLALVPGVALRRPTRKIAAVAALATGAGYYLLSGGNVATERAFVMVAVMFTAILVDRRAITLRAVAIAAVIVLSLRPESLLTPGFQMSFAATTALVAVFGALRDWQGWRAPKLLRPVLAVVLSSVVAGAATAPVAAAHFNRIADYGLVANLLSVPVMGLVVMPGAIAAAVLWPLGLAVVGITVMRLGIDWILATAHWIAGLHGAVTPIVSPQAVVLPALTLGLLWLILWQGRARLAGLAPAVLALAWWTQAERPPVLISSSGGLMGVMTEAGRSLSKARGDGFSALAWLENDGDGAPQDLAHARDGFTGDKGQTETLLAGARIVLVSGRGAEARAETACLTAALVVLAKSMPEDPARPCLMLDQTRLRETGALAIWTGPRGVRVVSAAETSGNRLWSPAHRGRGANRGTNRGVDQ